jgi:serralysin
VGTGSTGDGRADIIVGTGAGSIPLVAVFDGATLAKSLEFLAYPNTFTGGVRVGAGNRIGDPKPSIFVSPGPGFSPLPVLELDVLRNQNGTLRVSEFDSFFAYSLLFTGGVFVGGGR